MLVPQYKLVVNYIPYSGSVIMDTYKDEDLLLSNNLTEITEVDQIPYSLTRTFQLPGTNKNNDSRSLILGLTFQPNESKSVKKKTFSFDFSGKF